jgi:hypothetical protein
VHRLIYVSVQDHKQHSKQENNKFHWKVTTFQSINDDIEISKAEINLQSSVAHWGAGLDPLGMLHLYLQGKPLTLQQL